MVPTMSRMIAPFVLRNFSGVLDVPFESYEAFLKAFMLNRLEFVRRNLKIVKNSHSGDPLPACAEGAADREYFSSRFWSV
ncbi:hypothetical protein ACFTAO_37555 [Paenibacillus rhizoplanae]